MLDAFSSLVTAYLQGLAFVWAVYIAFGVIMWVLYD